MGWYVRGSNPTLPPVQWIQPGIDVEPLHTPYTKVKNEWWYISLPPVCFLGLDRVEFTSYKYG